MITEEEIAISSEAVMKISGALDANLDAMEKMYNVRIGQCQNGLIVSGDIDNAVSCAGLIRLLVSVIKQGQEINVNTIERCADMLKESDEGDVLDLFKECVAITAFGKKIFCKTMAQRKYCRAIKKNTLTFVVGPAGTGKTYLAVALAASAYKRGDVDRIILTRPAIEAGEKLGFLPGDLQMKVDPYLRPLYDALEEMFGVDKYSELMDRGIIEIAPLGFMRGRTLSRAFIILDEAQNTTEEQMKMFLTRMGDGSKVVVTGDVTQIDLPQGGKSGLSQAIKILDDIDDIAICRLSDKDVVRHELVRKIVSAYDNARNDGYGNKR